MCYALYTAGFLLNKSKKEGIYKLGRKLNNKGNYYYAKFRVNGKQKMLATKVPVKGNNKRKAERVLKELIAKYEGLNLENENILFTAFLDKWLQSVKPILKPATWESYDKTVSGKIKPYFEQKKLQVS